MTRINPDVVIAGGGIVGCALAFRLAREKLAVTLVDRGEIGREASWAAPGILAPAESPPSLAGLCDASLRLFPPLLRELAEFSSTDPEFRVTGLLFPALGDGGEAALRHIEELRRLNRRPAERLSRVEALDRHPGLSQAVRGAIFLPDAAQVRSHRLTGALHDAAVRRGATVRPGTPVTGFLRVPGRITGVKTPRGDIYAGTTILAAGAWTGELAGAAGFELPLRPVKGQMLLADAAPDFCRPMILEGETCLVPRADGRLLIGTTYEDAGFDKKVTLEAVQDICERSSLLMPEVKKLPLVATWAGLRPTTPDFLPHIGRAPVEGLIVATGHHQHGILLAPVTAELVTDLVTGRAPSIDLEPFNPSRPRP